MIAHTCRNPLHCIVPPHVHEHLSNHPDPAVRRRAIEAIQGSAKTGRIGDGKIFVIPLAHAIRIRTGEKGEAAV